MKGIKIIDAEDHSDDRGDLFVLEYLKNISFVVKRVYYITNVKADVVRGEHAHKQLKQAMFCTGGSCTLEYDNGYESMTVVLDHPGKVVLVDPGVWRKIHSFSPNSTLIVLASDEYNEKDYIRNYDDFLKYVEENI